MLPNYEWVTTIETEGKNSSENSNYIKGIVDKQFENNREYLDANFTSLASRDILTYCALQNVDYYNYRKNQEKKNYAENFRKELFSRTPDGKRLLNPKTIKEVYRGTGLCVADSSALKDKWPSLRKEAIDDLYSSIITKCGLSQYLNRENFEECVVSALKATSFYMQDGINYERDNNEMGR